MEELQRKVLAPAGALQHVDPAEGRVDMLLKILQSLSDFRFPPFIAGAHPNFGFWHARPRPAGHASRPDRLRREKVVFALRTSEKLCHSTTASTTTAAAFTQTSGDSPQWLFTAIRLCRSSGSASVRAKTSFLSTS